MQSSFVSAELVPMRGSKPDSSVGIVVGGRLEMLSAIRALSLTSTTDSPGNWSTIQRFRDLLLATSAHATPSAEACRKEVPLRPWSLANVRSLCWASLPQRGCWDWSLRWSRVRKRGASSSASKALPDWDREGGRDRNREREIETWVFVCQPELWGSVGALLWGQGREFV